MNCEKCDEKDKRIKEFEGLLERMGRYLDAKERRALGLTTKGFIETPSDRHAKVLAFSRPENMTITTGRKI